MSTYKVERIKFRATTTQTITNTTTETTQFPTGSGSRTIEVSNAVVNREYHIRLRGIISTGSGATATIRIKLGTVELLSNVGTLTNNLTNASVDFDFVLRIDAIGAGGSVRGNGMTRTTDAVGFAAVSGRSLYFPPASVDLTADRIIDVTYQWGSANPSNSLTITDAIVSYID